MKFTKNHLCLAAALVFGFASLPAAADAPPAGSFAPGSMSGATLSGSASVTPPSLEEIIRRQGVTAPAPVIDRVVKAKEIQDAYGAASGRMSTPEARALYSALVEKASTEERIKAMSPDFLERHPALAKNIEAAGLKDAVTQYHAQHK